MSNIYQFNTLAERNTASRIICAFPGLRGSHWSHPQRRSFEERRKSQKETSEVNQYDEEDEEEEGGGGRRGRE